MKRLKADEHTPDSYIHILRNPWGWHEDDVRAAQLAGADAIELRKAVDVLLAAKGRHNTQLAYAALWTARKDYK